MTICFTGWDNRMIFILRKTLWVTESLFYCPISSFHLLRSLLLTEIIISLAEITIFVDINFNWLRSLVYWPISPFLYRYHILTGLNHFLTGRDHFSLTGITLSMVLINFRLVEITFPLADNSGPDHFITGWDHFFNDQDHFSIGWNRLFVINKITKDRIDESYEIPQTLHTSLRRWHSVGC